VSGAVLIADGNRARARRIGDACAARGFATAFAPHGAAALEAALADVPDAVIAPLDLGLIDAHKLAEILRANPRAQGVRFLFLGRLPERERRASWFDEVLPPSADADEVALRVEALLAQRARMDAAWRDAETDRELQGRLSQIPLTDLLQLFHMNRRSGTIELARRESGEREERGTIWVRDGNLVQAAVGSVEGEKALFRLLAWRDGTFSFAPNRVSVTPRILTPTRAVLMEGMRQLDEWDRMRASLPPMDARVELRVGSAELPSGVHPLTQEVLLLLELYDRVGDVVDHSAHPDYQVLRTLQTLADRGMLALRQEPRSALAESAAEGFFAAPQIRRLREWLSAGRPRGAEPLEAKLLLFSQDEAATRDFARLLAEVPGMRLAEAARQGGIGATDLVPLGRITVDPGLAIRVIHVPADRRFAPIWPVAAHGALGSLLLLRGAERAAEERIAPLADALRRLPRARLFHLLLLQKGERLVPEEVQEKMARLGDGSLFLVPLEAGKDGASLLRTLLGRVIP
jgi:DNA-binding response OmpR family regulator